VCVYVCMCVHIFLFLGIVCDIWIASSAVHIWCSGKLLMAGKCACVCVCVCVCVYVCVYDV